MVRLVFRPYTHLRRSICTSESLRSSIRISPDFNLSRHSSPSFGSQRVYSACSQHTRMIGNGGIAPRAVARGSSLKITKNLFAFTPPLGLGHPMTRTHVRLLGPCFKTGQSLPDLLGRERAPATEALLAVRGAPWLPVGSRARTPGADPEGKASSRALGPDANSSYRDTDQRCTRRATQGSPQKVIADPRARAAPCR